MITCKNSAIGFFLLSLLLTISSINSLIIEKEDKETIEKLNNKFESLASKTEDDEKNNLYSEDIRKIIDRLEVINNNDKVYKVNPITGKEYISEEYFNERMKKSSVYVIVNKDITETNEYKTTIDKEIQYIESELSSSPDSKDLEDKLKLLKEEKTDLESGNIEKYILLSKEEKVLEKDRLTKILINIISLVLDFKNI